MVDISNDKCSVIIRIISSVMMPIRIIRSNSNSGDSALTRITLNCNAIVYDSVVIRKVAYDNNGVKARFNNDGIPCIFAQLVFVI